MTKRHDRVDTIEPISTEKGATGLEVVHADIARRLQASSSVADAVKLGVNKEFAEAHFRTRDAVSSTFER